MNNLYDETKFLMKKYSINANKNLGQNFLIDENVIYTAIDSANITKDDLVIEIGPGLGTLTKYLLEKAKKVICIELDSRMIDILKERFFLYKNFEIINEDVLKVDLQKLIEKEREKEDLKVKIVANLPYYITTPIIMKLLESKLSIESITVMVQKEVAKRLSAIPGEKDAGAITYSVYYYANCSEILLVPQTSFIPSPEVESEVINLKLRNEPAVKVNSEKLFFRIIKSSFMQRRKTLINGLVNSGIYKNKEEAKKCLNDLNIDEKARGETLTIEQFAKISNYIFNQNI